MTRIAALLEGRILRFFVVSLLLYAVVAIATRAPFLILIENGIVLSVSAGVCVAYAPVFFSALLHRRPSRGDYLGAGIFLGWSAVFSQRVLSIVAREFAWPEIYNTDWTTATIFLSLLSGLLHLSAPDAVEGRLPARRWVTTGIVVATGLFIAFLLWSGRGTNNFHPPIELR